MTLSALFSLISQALNVPFSVFGVTITMKSFWIFSFVMGALAWVLHRLQE